MATGITNPVLLLSILLPLLLISTTTARPCKTIFFITTTTTTSSSSDQFQNPLFLHQNPNPNHHLTFFITEVHRFHYPRRFHQHHHQPFFFDQNDVISAKPHHNSINLSVTSSIRARTMDIMSIVGALLFGVGCGALTAATMYLIWSLFSSRTFDFSDSSDDEFDGVDEDDVSPKKMGYVAIPAPTIAAAEAPVVKKV